MKKLIFSIVALCACAGAASAAETVLLYETFASGQGAFTIENVNLPSSTDYVWNFSDSYMKASAYIGGTPYAADSWLISPTFDLPRSYRSATLTFEHAAKFQSGTVNEEFQVYYAVNPSATFNASEWTKLAIPTYPTAGSWTFVSSGEISLPINATKIAFRYKSTETAADTWEVKNVKIVADEYDEGEAFYVYNSDGTTIAHEIAKVDSISFTRPISTATTPTLSGAFSVADGKQIAFSRGNLQYTQSTATWAFAENQYDMIGTANVSGGTDSYDATYGYYKSGSALADKIDLFGWSGDNETAKWGISTSTDYSDYLGDFVDWGKNIGDGTTYRTLTYDEWYYLRYTRTNADNLIGVARINLNSGGTKYANGLILLPDDWTAPAGITFKSGFADSSGVEDYATYQAFSLADWQKLEAAGAVFLPASGYRGGSNMVYVQDYGGCWSATAYDSYYAYDLYFRSDDAGTSYYGDRNCGRAVRLVQDVK